MNKNVRIIGRRYPALVGAGMESLMGLVAIKKKSATFEEFIENFKSANYKSIEMLSIDDEKQVNEMRKMFNIKREKGGIVSVSKNENNKPDEKVLPVEEIKKEISKVNPTEKKDTAQIALEAIKKCAVDGICAGMDKLQSELLKEITTPFNKLSAKLSDALGKIEGLAKPSKEVTPIKMEPEITETLDDKREVENKIDEPSENDILDKMQCMLDGTCAKIDKSISGLISKFPADGKPPEDVKINLEESSPPQPESNEKIIPNEESDIRKEIRDFMKVVRSDIAKLTAINATNDDIIDDSDADNDIDVKYNPLDLDVGKP